jgi:ribosomal subunit interface protein
VAHHHDKDLYAAIDIVSEKGERQLRDHKEQRQQGHR